MKTPKPEELIDSKEFQALSEPKQISLMAVADPDFAKLDLETQRTALAKVMGRQGPTPMPKLEPVLREQPSTMQSLTNPGGILSAESLGSMTGGVVGGALGTPFGPLGIAGGAVLGAGAGSMAGRGYEMLLEKIYGPYRTGGTLPLRVPERSIGNVVSEIGEASQRGMLGQAVGTGVAAAVNKAISPMARAVTGDTQRVLAQAERLGIDITPGQVLQHPAMSRLEKMAGNSVMGAGRVSAARQLQAGQVSNAVDDFAESLAPGLAKDYHAVGDAIKAVAEGRTSGLKSAVSSALKSVSGGTVLPKAEMGKAIIESKGQRLDALKAVASKLYDNVKVAAGDAAETVEAPRFAQVVNEIVERESSLTGVQLRSAGMAKGAASQLTPRGETIDPASLPAKLFAEYTTPENRIWSLDGLRNWQSRLGALATETPNRLARRDYARAFAAVSKDIDEWGDNLAPEAKTILKTANEFYKTRVAEVYFNRVVQGIEKAEPDMVAGLFLGPGKSIVAMDRIKTAIGDKTFKLSVASHLDDVMSTAKAPDGKFDPTKALAKLNEYPRPILEKMFGENIQAADMAINMLRANPTRMLDGIMGANGDKVVDMLLPKQGSIETIGQMRRLLPPELFDRTAGALIKKVVERSHTNTGEFSFDAFLTQVNSRTGYSQPQLRALLGDQYGNFRDTVNLVARINENLKLSGNPSGTGQALTSQFQIGGAIWLGSDIAAQTWKGQEDIPAMMKHLGAGLAILSPSALGRLMYTKGGLKWLTQAKELAPGSAAAVKAVAQLPAILASDAIGITPEREQIKLQRESLMRRQITDALKTEKPIAEHLQGLVAGAKIGASVTNLLKPRGATP